MKFLKKKNKCPTPHLLCNVGRAVCLLNGFCGLPEPYFTTTFCAALAVRTM